MPKGEKDHNDLSATHKVEQCQAIVNPYYELKESGKDNRHIKHVEVEIQYIHKNMRIPDVSSPCHSHYQEGH